MRHPDVGLSIDAVNSRDELPALFCKLGYRVGVEVGVQRGGFSATILRGWPGVLHSVDCWESQPDYLDTANAQDHGACEAEARRVLGEFGERSHILRQFSEEAVKIFPPESLDFVYLDARHDYPSVLADLRAWAPTLRAGGFLGGHDWVEDGETCGTVFGVRRAVMEWAAGRNIRTTLETKWASWYVIL